MTTIIGISGLKGSGKDTFAQVIKKRIGPTCVILHFAARLKEGCLRVFPFLSFNDVGTVLGKQRVLGHSGVWMDKYLDAMRQEFQLDIAPAGLVAKTVRELLQLVGTEYVRHADPDYWVRQVQVPPGAEVVLVPDTRFDNEAARIREMGGAVVQVCRDKVTVSLDAHPSEQLTKPDYILHVKTGDMSPYHFVADTIAWFGAGLPAHEVLPLFGC